MEKSTPHLTTLSILAGMYILVQIIIVPALPDIQAQFGTNYKTIQFSISGYLLAVAFVNFISGPLSDRYGRRPIMIMFFFIFMIASVGCFLSVSLEAFLVFRVFQASSAAGLVLSRAIIGDIYSEKDTVKMLGLLSIAMGIAPSLAPLAGGIINEFFGAKQIFLFLSIISVLLLIIIFHDLKETHHKQSKDIFSQIKTYPALLKSIPFWLPTFTFSLSFSIFGVFFIGGPFIASHSFDLSPTLTGVYLACPALGYILGNILVSKVANKFSTRSLMVWGSIILTFGPILSLLASLSFFHPLSFYLPVLLMTFGSGIIWPASNAEILKAVPSLAGSASGLGSAIMTLTSSLAAAVTGLYIESFNPIIFISLLLIGIGLTTFISALFTRNR